MISRVDVDALPWSNRPYDPGANTRRRRTTEDA
jgi:hypothetical protein